MLKVLCSGGDNYISEETSLCPKRFECQKYQDYLDELKINYYPHSIKWDDCVKNDFNIFKEIHSYNR